MPLPPFPANGRSTTVSGLRPPPCPLPSGVLPGCASLVPTPSVRRLSATIAGLPRRAISVCAPRKGVACPSLVDISSPPPEGGTGAAGAAARMSAGGTIGGVGLEAVPESTGGGLAGGGPVGKRVGPLVPAAGCPLAIPGAGGLAPMPDNGGMAVGPLPAAEDGIAGVDPPCPAVCGTDWVPPDEFPPVPSLLAPVFGGPAVIGAVAEVGALRLGV